MAKSIFRNGDAVKIGARVVNVYPDRNLARVQVAGESEPYIDVPLDSLSSPTEEPQLPAILRPAPVGLDSPGPASVGGAAIMPALAKPVQPASADTPMLTQ